MRTTPGQSIALLVALLTGGIASGQERLPLPERADLSRARIALHRQHRSSYNSARTEKPAARSLAERLLKPPRESATPAEEYVRLSEALELATRALSPPLAIRSARALAKRFQVASDVLLLKALGKMAHSKSPMVLKQVFAHAVRICHESMARGRNNLARTAAAIAGRAATRTRDPGQRAMAKALRAQALEGSDLSDSYEEALATLKKQPQDTDALVCAGLFEVCVRGELKVGLGRWSASKDAGFRRIAKLEAAMPTSAEGCHAVARAWLKKARLTSGVVRQGMRCRAIHWIASALRKLKLGAKRYELSAEINRLRHLTASGPLSAASLKAATPLWRHRNLMRRDPRVAQACLAGAQWLARHGESDGRWKSGGFNSRCEDDPCDGLGNRLFDVGVSALALRAIMASGASPQGGRHSDVIFRGLDWLVAQQGSDGMFVRHRMTSRTYEHAIGTLAVLEAYGLTGSRHWRKSAEKAIAAILKMQNPDKGWRYGLVAGKNDTSVTAWMVEALALATELGLEVDPGRLKWAHHVIEMLTDKQSGRVGYQRCGEPPVRMDGRFERFPPSLSESCTACGLYVRLRTGDAISDPVLGDGFHLLAKRLPHWSLEGNIDMYYWERGSLAIQRSGDARLRKKWFAALNATAIRHQRSDSCARGSWDPCGAWGADGGRIYSTAMMILAIQAPYLELP